MPEIRRSVGLSVNTVRYSTRCTVNPISPNTFVACDVYWDAVRCHPILFLLLFFSSKIFFLHRDIVFFFFPSGASRHYFNLNISPQFLFFLFSSTSSSSPIQRLTLLYLDHDKKKKGRKNKERYAFSLHIIPLCICLVVWLPVVWRLTKIHPFSPSFLILPSVPYCYDHCRPDNDFQHDNSLRIQTVLRSSYRPIMKPFLTFKKGVTNDSLQMIIINSIILQTSSQAK